MTDAEPKLPKFTPGAQMAIFWRILHLTIGQYGNHPTGQLLVALTMAFLHDRGARPTLTDLCKATGLPKATVSRYVSWQLRHGLAEEVIDPDDRRRRVLLRTKKGAEAWKWQGQQMKKLFDRVIEVNEGFRRELDDMKAEAMFEAMKRVTKEIYSSKDNWDAP